MKIICIRCKKIMGEQEPWDDPSERSAKCDLPPINKAICMLGFQTYFNIDYKR